MGCQCAFPYRHGYSPVSLVPEPYAIACSSLAAVVAPAPVRQRTSASASSRRACPAGGRRWIRRSPCRTHPPPQEPPPAQCAPTPLIVTYKPQKPVFAEQYTYPAGVTTYHARCQFIVDLNAAQLHARILVACASLGSWGLLDASPVSLCAEQARGAGVLRPA